MKNVKEAGYVCLILMSLCSLPALHHIHYNKDMLMYWCSLTGPHTFLLSYPRSGNSWLRYCLEKLTLRPTFSRIGFYDKKQQPLAWHAPFEIDLTKSPIEKVHLPREVHSPHDWHDKLIMIVRNPKEALMRNEHRKLSLPLLQGRTRRRGYTPASYFENLEFFNTWNPDNRLLIYYEDLLMYPRHELLRILIFLEEPVTRLDDFMSNYQEHVALSIKLYKKSASKGSDPLFHSRSTDQEYRLSVDQWITDLYPELWNTYLKDKYAEPNLDYLTK